MWDYLELGYEAYQNNYPTILKDSPPMIQMQKTLDLRGDIMFVLNGSASESAHYTGFIIGCGAMWAVAAPFCSGMFVIELLHNYLQENVSYSRWINSSFYTYWCSSKVYDKHDELFACHTSLEGQYMFTYTECKEFINEPFELVSRIKDISLTDEEVKEIVGYMSEFVSDVDLSYEKKLINLRGGQ